MTDLNTAEDLRKTGQQLAVAFRMSNASRSAAQTFNEMQNNRVDEIGALIEDDSDLEKQLEAVTLIGELRTGRAVPYLRKALRRVSPYTTSGTSPDEIMFSRIATSLFRTQSLGGHKLIRQMWQYQNSRFAPGLRNLLVESYQGSQSDLSWRLWSAFKCDYKIAQKRSDQGNDKFNNQFYLTALELYSDAVRAFPYFSGFWRQMGDAKVRLAKDGSDTDIKGFKEWWSAEESGDELRERINCGSWTDYRVASELAPYLPGDLVDIGYGMAMADNHIKAEEAYQRALDLKPNIDQRAYILFRRAETFEATGKPEKALEDYSDSIRKFQLAITQREKGGMIKTTIPYAFEDMIKDINERVERLR
ncbi:MAG: hypothetical protein ABII01_00750 [Candidatus Woesearchaeota archaeon]